MISLLLLDNFYPVISYRPSSKENSHSLRSAISCQRKGLNIKFTFICVLYWRDFYELTDETDKNRFDYFRNNLTLNGRIIFFYVFLHLRVSLKELKEKKHAKF